MKTIYQNIILLASILLLFSSCGCEEAKVEKQAVNYVVLLDLSDRILVPEQLDKDFALIATAFKSFEKQARQNLVLSSKDRFSIKIIPQKNSPLNVNHYEDLLQLYLDETEVAAKNNSLVSLSRALPTILENLKKDALYGKTSNTYFGVDIWAYLHDNGMDLSKSGLLPIHLDKNTQWIVAGISGKKANDILQTEKITYFWEKWLKQSGVKKVGVILNSSKTAMSSKLSAQL
jgi:hypothetical protein